MDYVTMPNKRYIHNNCSRFKRLFDELLFSFFSPVDDSKRGRPPWEPTTHHRPGASEGINVAVCTGKS